MRRPVMSLASLHDQEQIENKERSGNVVEGPCNSLCWQQLIGSPEMKGRRQHDHQENSHFQQLPHSTGLRVPSQDCCGSSLNRYPT